MRQPVSRLPAFAFAGSIYVFGTHRDVVVVVVIVLVVDGARMSDRGHPVGVECEYVFAPVCVAA